MREYVLLVGVYRDTGEAVADLADLRRQAGADGVLGGAAVLARNPGRAVLQTPGGGTFAYTITTGAAVGVALGGLLGFPLTLLAIGALVGAIVGRQRSQEEMQRLLAAVGDAVPPGSVALLAVVDERYLLELRGGLTRALRTTGRLLDGELAPVGRSLVRGNPAVAEALARNRPESG